MPQVLPLEADFYFKGLFSKDLITFHFVNESFDVLTYLWLFLDCLEKFFAIYPLLILNESVGWTKHDRNLRFGTHYCFIIFYRLWLSFFYKLGPLSCNGPLNSRSQNLQETRIIGTFLFQLLSLRAVHCSSMGLYDYRLSP